ncbi:TPM domain-containing protein [Nocardia amamiensis]|uniref:TPM domain-containing protein n=1 Tax=Nocardia amamiensis TaxID=404578 RepID=A0ABS0CYN9_9NOCA|nr:TPM domain-containing protein [Nocardia amamiensis]MBF6301481.1 TPM domain-containing protein [Nocardia amamiensis]
MALPPRNRLARRFAIGVVLAAIALSGGGTVAAEPPLRMNTYVEDPADALDDLQRDQIRWSVDQLYADQQIRLWVVYVRDFDGLDPRDWALRTASMSGFGERDLLLAVATEDRAYWLEGEVPSGVSDSELDDILISEVEPALREGRWADAGIAAADGLDAAMRGGGVSGRALVVIGLLIVFVAGGLLWYARKRRRARSEAELAAARQLDPENTTALSALPPDALQARSREALVEIDNAVRTSGEELDLATAEFGVTATTPFRTALEHARAAAAEAFAIRQRLDDAIPETPEQQRALLVELISTVGRADRELDAQVAEFDAMRDLLLGATARLDALTRDIVDVTARVPGSEAELHRLAAAHPASVLAPIHDNVRMTRERIAFAEQSIDAGRSALSRPVGEQGGAVSAIRSAEAAIGQARVLLDAVDNASTTIQQARDGLPGVLDELRRDIAAATELSAHGGPELAAARDAAQSVLDKAAAAADVDPLSAFHDAVTADTDLDRALATATDRKRAAEDLRRRLDRTLTDARARIGAAADYITTRRGGIDAEARTRLSEAQRHLDEAQRLTSSDQAEALRHAQAAADLGGRALQAAQTSVRAWESSRAPSGSAHAGAVLGGILLEAVLRGAAGGVRHSGGGWSPGSYGGSGGSRRIGRGGRF